MRDYKNAQVNLIIYGKWILYVYAIQIMIKTKEEEIIVQKTREEGEMS